MDFTEYGRNPTKKFVGISLVILLHVIVIYALVTGLARKVVDVINKPVETQIIEEVKPPPPPKQPKAPPPPPKRLAPPPPFVPPPEVHVPQTPQQNTIKAVTDVKPDNPVMPPIQAVPAPPRVPLRVPAVVDPKACEKPEYPRKSLRNEEQGTVTLAFLIGLDGQVVDSKVEKSSGSKDLDRAAIAALSLCKFKPGTVDGKPEQSWTRMQYVWKLE